MLNNLNLKTAVWVYDIENFCILWANDAALELWQSTSLEELYSRNFRDDTSDAVKESLKDYQQRFHFGESMCELWQFSPGGEAKQAFCQLSGVEIDDKMTMMVEATAVDLMQPLMGENAIAILATFDEQGQFKSCNPPFDREFSETRFSLNSLICDSALHSKILRLLQSHYRCEIDVQLNAKIGKVWFRAIVTNSENEFGERTILFNLYNINERKIRELNLLEQAQTDPLTGLMNRRGISDLLQERVNKQLPFSLFYIDLDGFKLINDSLGHGTGDQILKEVANRLNFMSTDETIPCRFGGDEFIYVVNGVDNKENTKLIATALVESLSALYQDNKGNFLVVSASIGFSKYPEDSDCLEDIVRFADAAMYNSKKLGKKRWTRYKMGMDKDILRKSSLAQHASLAIKNNELRLYYQPIMDFKTNSISSFEALLRWHNPDLGEISPQELIVVAEEIGLIADIENWVIETALADLKKLREYSVSNATISINITRTHVVDPGLLPFLLQNLSLQGLMQSDLILEITESVLVEALDLSDNPIDKIINAGISLSIDDFGTGHSSLAYLHKFNANSVKINRVFLSSSEFGLVTLAALHKLISSLGMNSVVEGIETEQQADAVSNIGINLRQGNFYAAPNPIEFYKNN